MIIQLIQRSYEYKRWVFEGLIEEHFACGKTASLSTNPPLDKLPRKTCDVYDVHVMKGT